MSHASPPESRVLRHEHDTRLAVHAVGVLVAGLGLWKYLGITDPDVVASMMSSVGLLVVLVTRRLERKRRAIVVGALGGNGTAQS